jgi:phosphotransferase system enzyme I (PtsP)
LKELRPIREGRGSQNPNFKYIPGIFEEQYEAFLAVPILHGLTRIGVLVVQDGQPDYFNEHDVKALRAIAAQLATTIENAQLFMSLHNLHDTDEGKQAPSMTTLAFIKGRPASPGIAWGTAAPMGLAGHVDREERKHAHSLDDFQQALDVSEHQLKNIQKHMDEDLSDVASLIFNAQLLMLKDKSFSGAMEQLIEAGTAPEQAIQQVSDKYIGIFQKSGNPRLREKVQDVYDLRRRLRMNLTEKDGAHESYEGRIVVAGSLVPSDILKFSAQNAEGLVMVDGGLTAHVAILARSLKLPTIICDNKRLLTDLEGTEQLLLDANQGNLFINPDEAVRSRYEALHTAEQEAGAAQQSVVPETQTSDGERVQLLANVNLISDLQSAKLLKAEGIGLYRSEFPFIVRDNFPSEEEQHRIYRRIVEEMEDREVTFRTLDVGGDKMLSYFPKANESNPFLGLRAIRFSLKHPGIFRQQLRAMLRAGVDGNIRIMFPLVSSLDDFLDARDVVHQCMDELRNEQAPCTSDPKLGVMIELPSAVEIADDLAREVDFISIGTNDLVQYMLAVDRTNEAISHLYMYHHPAILRAIKRVIDAAARYGTDLSVCGEMAAESRMIPFLVGAGLRKLSVSVNAIPSVQRVITGISLSQARIDAERVLRMSRIRETASALGFDQESA